MSGEKCMIPACLNHSDTTLGMWMQAIPDIRLCSEDEGFDANLQKAGFICMFCWNTIFLEKDDKS